jgi:coenzyme F420-reducing hydrogenase delta subunit
MNTSPTPPNWEPRIVAFVCNWCLYSRLDQADIARVRGKPNVRIIRIPCLGRMDPMHVLTALEEGIDGVLVAGCQPGDCHYKRGNYLAENRMHVLQTVLEANGDGGRVKFAHVSTAERGIFPRLIEELAEEVRALGQAEEPR